MSDKVLITGGAGFIGSHVARTWCDRGADVTILDSLRSGFKDNIEGLDCEFVEGSVEDPDLVKKLTRDVDYIHHLAALVSVPESVEKPIETQSINTNGTINILEGAKENGVKKVVLSSTSAVYGFVERPFHSETDLPAPASPYAVSKLAAEHYMNTYNKLHGVPTATLRYFNVFGPGQDPNSAYAAAIAIFSQKARKNEDLTIYGDGEQTRDFVFVEDVVQANIIAATQGEGLYNVACNSRITINDLAKEIISLSNSKSEIKYAQERKGDIKHSRGKSDRLVELGWKPATPLREGLDKTLGKV